MMEELKHHGYRIGPGTLYPLLHGMERDGLLKSELKNVTGRKAQTLQNHRSGRKALKKAKTLVDALHHELHEEHPRRVSDLEISEPGESTAQINRR